jgi:hypothetical protein
MIVTHGHYQPPTDIISAWKPSLCLNLEKPVSARSKALQIQMTAFSVFMHVACGGGQPDQVHCLSSQWRTI